ncbi:uncharacterized protein LOC130900750 [Diorhabda carinulata]|uniref:uncharacterized protein LOC130900750 n=1 Tax=Diorhabda carinulata TaxID=1163345 RepID=UPI0025A1E677|nr:uncharacterized protein LOC130900750 [Diorhabda carinulata]
MVVNASGDTSVIRSSQVQQRPAAHAERNSGLEWCISSPSNTARNSFFVTWCRPTILLLFLLLLVVIFVLVSGILLYHNYLVHKPRQTASAEAFFSCQNFGRFIIHIMSFMIDMNR